MSKVSICIPAYKDKAGMIRLLKSIKEQSYKDFEIIVSDDTPDDSIKELLNDAQYSEMNIQYYEGTHIRACENWNRSIALASGEYIKIMHQDDWFTDSDSLEKFVKMLDDNPDAILAFSGSRQVTVNPSNIFDYSNFYDRCISDENLSNMQKDYRDLYNGDWVGAPSATLYRKCDVQFDPALTWIIDIDFYIHLLSSGKNFVCDKAPLISIGVSENQLTNSCIEDADLNIREYSHVMKKYKLNEFPEYRHRLAYIAVIYKKKYKDIKDLGVLKSEYKDELKKRQKYLLDFYKKLIIRKLFRHG